MLGMILLGRVRPRSMRSFRVRIGQHFSLELQTVLVHLRCDDLIIEGKAKPADPADATTTAGIEEFVLGSNRTSSRWLLFVATMRRLSTFLAC